MTRSWRRLPKWAGGWTVWRAEGTVALAFGIAGSSRRAFGGPRDAQQRVILEAEAGRWPKLGVHACPAGGWSGGGQLLGRGGRRAKGRGAWGAVLVGGSGECEAADVGSWWQPVAFT